jgi:hypothetical protein
MQTQIRVGMVFRVGGDFGEPRAGHHDTRRSNRILVQGVETGSVHGMGHGKIIGMNDEKFRIGWITQAFGYSFILCTRGADGKTGEQGNGGKISKAHRELQ